MPCHRCVPLCGASPSVSPPRLPRLSPRARQTMYRLAQAVHSVIQGHVGSGFDISAAFRGAQVYTRFSPSLLGPLISPPHADAAAGASAGEGTPPARTEASAAAAATVAPTAGGAASADGMLPPALAALTGHDLVACCHGEHAPQWDDVALPFALPPGMNVILGDGPPRHHRRAHQSSGVHSYTQ